MKLLEVHEVHDMHSYQNGSSLFVLDGCLFCSPDG